MLGLGQLFTVLRSDGSVRFGDEEPRKSIADNTMDLYGKMCYFLSFLSYGKVLFHQQKLPVSWSLDSRIADRNYRHNCRYTRRKRSTFGGNLRKIIAFNRALSVRALKSTLWMTNLCFLSFHLVPSRFLRLKSSRIEPRASNQMFNWGANECWGEFLLFMMVIRSCTGTCFLLLSIVDLTFRGRRKQPSL